MGLIIDVHHGNGTEETVRWLQPHCTETEYFNNNGFGKMYTPRYKPWFSEKDSDNVLFVSVHGYGPRQRGLESLFPAAAFYPGSGKTVVPEISSKVTICNSIVLCNVLTSSLINVDSIRKGHNRRSSSFTTAVTNSL